MYSGTGKGTGYKILPIATERGYRWKIMTAWQVRISTNDYNFITIGLASYETASDK